MKPSFQQCGQQRFVLPFRQGSFGFTINPHLPCAKVNLEYETYQSFLLGPSVFPK
jgi:hypothetical protein